MRGSPLPTMIWLDLGKDTVGEMDGMGDMGSEGDMDGLVHVNVGDCGGYGWGCEIRQSFWNGWVGTKGKEVDLEVISH